MEIQLRETLALVDRMTRILAHHTGQPYDRVKKDIDRDYFMTAEEAKQYGVIDAVIEPRRGLGFEPAAAAAATR
jgi:ATP-dependent Clp protease protease subunit